MLLAMVEKEVRRSAFVLRIWQDDDGRTWGQVSEPMTGWQRPFASLDALSHLLLEQMSTHSVKGDNSNEPIE